jgi:hypothetical protein
MKLRFLAGNPPTFVVNFSRQGYEPILSLGEVMRQEKHSSLIYSSSNKWRIYGSEVAMLWYF